MAFRRLWLGPCLPASVSSYPDIPCRTVEPIFTAPRCYTARLPDNYALSNPGVDETGLLGPWDACSLLLKLNPVYWHGADENPALPYPHPIIYSAWGIKDSAHQLKLHTGQKEQVYLARTRTSDTVSLGGLPGLLSRTWLERGILHKGGLAAPVPLR